MKHDKRKHNKDHYNIRGSDPGPDGTFEGAKRSLAQEQAVLHRDQERRLPGEKPLSGERTPEPKARRESRDSALDRLPRPVGAAGIPASQKPSDSD